jgi:GTP1/Obg family GTP-binding protein
VIAANYSFITKKIKIGVQNVENRNHTVIGTTTFDLRLNKE